MTSIAPVGHALRYARTCLNEFGEALLGLANVGETSRIGTQTSLRILVITDLDWAQRRQVKDAGSLVTIRVEPMHSVRRSVEKDGDLTLAEALGYAQWVVNRHDDLRVLAARARQIVSTADVTRYKRSLRHATESSDLYKKLEGALGSNRFELLMAKLVRASLESILASRGVVTVVSPCDLDNVARVAPEAYEIAVAALARGAARGDRLLIAGNLVQLATGRSRDDPYIVFGKKVRCSFVSLPRYSKDGS